VKARVVRNWSIHGFEACILENASLRVTVLPELGGKVLELVDKAADRDLLWHNPRLPLRRAPYRAEFDDWWSGGWDEVFPTGDIARFDNEPLPYMGELWSVPWSVQQPEGESDCTVTTSVETTMTAAHFERRLELRGDEPVLRARYQLTNVGLRPMPFLWGIHPALAVTDAHRLDVPASQMLVGVSSGPSFGNVGETYTWPFVVNPSSPSEPCDMRVVRPASDSVFGGHWATDLREGWLAATDRGRHRGVALSFSLDVFPNAWLWLTYGGYRGHRHVILEPWTGRPMQLQDAIAAGTARSLGPGERLEAEVAFVIYSGLDLVRSVTKDGDMYVFA
jgi:galactose mutarotase-like enzyme